MRHENRPYYVGPLKAAELQGASHHAVMEFQIITNKQIPRCGSGAPCSYSTIARIFRRSRTHYRISKPTLAR
nr:type IV toxin-antitoxin system AbiEi family antitoxin [Bradyrhizobium algeriense]